MNILLKKITINLQNEIEQQTKEQKELRMERSSVSARAQLSAEVTPGYELHKNTSVKKYNANGKKAGESVIFQRLREERN